MRKKPATKFGERLTELRINKELSIEVLANALETSISKILSWENNQTEPNFKFLIKIAQYFNVKIGYLIGLEN